MLVEERFVLPEQLKTQLRERPTQFGFGGLGEAVFYTRYSRQKDDGTQETWADVIIRAIEGNISIQKDYVIKKFGRNKWGGDERWYSQVAGLALAAYDRELILPGRSYWAMGTDYIFERGSAALNNCGWVEVTHLAKDCAWIMDMLMCGVGVGFSTDRMTLKSFFRPNRATTRTYVIPDSREGWVESLKLLIESYQYIYQPTVDFDYSKIRVAGEPIRGFGGTASGADPLKKLHERVRTYLERAVEEFLRYGMANTVRLITDICNAIGACVVAGNVRRSAEIALGSMHDHEFINLKNYDMYPEREEIGWMSNNSVRVENEYDYHMLPNIAERIVDNGEPGFVNMNLINKYGRIGEHKHDNATGINPCGEQPLASHELCCLVELNTPLLLQKGPWRFNHVAQYATWYANNVTLLPTHDERTNTIMKQNRRIGVSVSGVADATENLGDEYIMRSLDEGYQTIQQSCLQYASEYDLPMNIRTTTVKPSGTVSLLAGISPGMHWPTFTHYIRRMRLSSQSKMVEALVEAGVPWDIDPYSDNTLVFDFPVTHGNTRAADKVTMWEQAIRAADLAKIWSDNSVSATVYFDKEREGPQVEDLLAYIVNQVKALSMLPHMDHGYEKPPYEERTLDEVMELTEKIKPINFEQFIQAGLSSGTDTRFCDGDSCDVNF